MKIINLLIKKTAILLLVGTWISLSACSSAQEEVAPTDSDEFITLTVNGKEFTGSATSLGDADYFYVWGIVEINTNDGYSVQIELDQPKVGTYTNPKNPIKASISTLSGTVANPSIQEFAMPANGKGTVTFSQFDPKGYAEGTFSFTGQNKSGPKIDVTGGKFRVDLR